jgi:hypothetical protein
MVADQCAETRFTSLELFDLPDGCFRDEEDVSFQWQYDSIGCGILFAEYDKREDELNCLILGHAGILMVSGFKK